MLILKSKIDKNIADAKNLLTKVIEAEYEQGDRFMANGKGIMLLIGVICPHCGKEIMPYIAFKPCPHCNK